MPNESVKDDFRRDHESAWDTIGKIGRAVGIAGAATAGIGAIFGNRNVARAGAAAAIGGMAVGGISNVMSGDRPRWGHPWGGFGMPMVPPMMADIYAWRARQMAYFNNYVAQAMAMGRWAHMSRPHFGHMPPPRHLAHHGPGPRPGPRPGPGMGPRPGPGMGFRRGGRA